MLNKINFGPEKKKLIVYIFLAVITVAVFWQVHQHDFITFDDRAYVTQNPHIKSGLTSEGIRWTFTSKYFGLWNPLVWLSYLADYSIFGLNAGGYHMVNLVLHILSTLLLFWLFNRMTGALWKSAFVAGFFAFHPLHVESVSWIAERKDVLSAFFWMLTLCLYVYYTEKPDAKRYLGVVFSFCLALMSKPMVVTLPIIMIILDYWPLGRFKSKKINLLLWQLKEKSPLFVLSFLLVAVTLYPGGNSSSLKPFPLNERISNAVVSFAMYLEKTLWPFDLTILYPFASHMPLLQITGASLLIIFISVIVFLTAKRMPYLLAGWLWYAVTVLPVLGIIQISLTTPYAMADRYHYLPSIGIAIMIAWGTPALIKRERIRRNFILPVGIAFLAIMAMLAWKQCGYWRNTVSIFNHALQVTKDNHVAHNNLGIALFAEGKTEEAIHHYNEAIRLTPHDAEPYFNRGTIYDGQGNFRFALDDFNRAVGLKPDYADAYINRGNVYSKQGNYQLAIKDYNKAASLKPDDSEIYYNRGGAYGNLGQYEKAVNEYNQAISMKPDDSESYNNRGAVYAKTGQYQRALSDFSKAISLNPYFTDAYGNRAYVYFKQGSALGCKDAQDACKLGKCGTWKVAQNSGLCK
jgi:protein O-mannosyl-transferase